MKTGLAVALWALTVPGAAVAEDLLKIYDDALQSDPQMREATATRAGLGAESVVTPPPP